MTGKKVDTRITKEEMYMEIAETVSKRSSCSRLHVGSVVVTNDLKNIVSIGYNGNYAGGPNSCDSNVPGSCGCIHAEANALLKPGRTGGEILFVTDSPCLNCSKLIINSGISKVYYRNKYRKNDGIKLLKSKIKVCQLKK